MRLSDCITPPPPQLAFVQPMTSLPYFTFALAAASCALHADLESLQEVLSFTVEGRGRKFEWHSAGQTSAKVEPCTKIHPAIIKQSFVVHERSDYIILSVEQVEESFNHDRK